jgi:transposase-like protein
MRRSNARDLICPTCKQQSLIKAGKTTPDKKTGKFYQRYRCTNPKCQQTITLKPLEPDLKVVEVKGDAEVLIIKRDDKGRFIRK